MSGDDCECLLCRHGGGDADEPRPEDTITAWRKWFADNGEPDPHEPAVYLCVHGFHDCVSCDWTDGRAAGTLRT